MTHPDSPESLAANAARGVMWTGAGQVVRQLVQIVSQLVLVRLLVPGDFGLLGMAMFFVGVGQLLVDFGIGSALVQSGGEDRVLISSCFWLGMAVAGALTLSTLACSPLIASFYGRVDLAPLVAVLSLNLLISGLQVVPSALLYRDMRFADLARAQVLATLLAAVVAIMMASLGAGVWALVAQPLVGGVVVLCLYAVAAKWRPRFEFSWPLVAPLARFSAALLGTSLLGYASRNVDGLLIGRTLGAGPLGHYSMAIQLMLYPLQQVSSVIVRVLFPTLVHLKEDLPRLRSAYMKAVGTIALLAFPIMGGLFSLADNFVLVVFGPSWIEMIPVLKVLAWVGMLQSIGTTVGTIYLSTNNMQIALRVTLLATPVLIGGMIVGLPWGIFGVAMGYAVATLLVSFYTFITAFAVINLSLGDFFSTISRPFLATVLMIIILLMLIPALDILSATLQLGTSIVLGIISYGIASIVINRVQLNEVISILRSLRAK